MSALWKQANNAAHTKWECEQSDGKVRQYGEWGWDKRQWQATLLAEATASELK